MKRRSLNRSPGPVQRVIFVPTIIAKNCADICGIEDEPRSDISNHNELSQCMEEEKLKNTK